MTIGTPVILDTQTDNANSATITSDPVSPSAHAVLLAFSYNSDNTIRTPTSITDTLTGTTTWVQLQTLDLANAGGRGARFYVWWAQAGASPGTGAVTVNLDGNSRRKQLHVVEVPGDAPEVVQSAKAQATSGTTLDVPLGSTPDAASAVVGAVVNNTSNPDPVSGYTGLSDTVLNNVYLDSQYDLGSPVTCGWAGLQTEFGGLAVEVAEATTGVVLVIADLLSSAGIEGGLVLTQVHGPLTIGDLLSAAVLEGNLVLSQHLGALTVADLLSGAAVEGGLVLTQHHGPLVVSDLLTAAALESITLQQYLGALVIGDLQSATFLDAISLTQRFALVVSELLASAILEGIALQQHHGPLSVSDLQSATFIDTLNLSGTVALVIADLLSGTGLEGIALLQHHSLGVSDLLSAALLEGPFPLQQHHVLVPSDLYSNTLLESIILSVSGALAVQDMLSSSGLDVIQLTQHHPELAVQGLTSVTTLDALVLALRTSLQLSGMLSTATLSGPIQLQQHHGLLSVSDLLSQTLLDNVTFGTVAYQLVIADLLSAATLEQLALGITLRIKTQSRMFIHHSTVSLISETVEGDNLTERVEGE